MTTIRDPYPIEKYDNDDNFRGKREIYMKSFDKFERSEIEAQKQKDPWNQLHNNRTFSNSQRTVYKFDGPEVPQDDLDFVLKTEYNHHADTLKPKNETLFQKETILLDQKLSSDKKFEEKDKMQMRAAPKVVVQSKAECIHSIHHHQAIESHHSETTNRGYSTKPEGGGFYTT